MKRKIHMPVLAILASLALSSCTDLLVEAQKADKDFVESNKAELAIVFPSGDSADCVTGDLRLPAAMSGCKIAWASAMPDVVSASGVITRPAFDAGSATVELVATISSGSETRTKAFTITVLPLEPTDAQAIAADALALNVGLGTNASSTGISQDLELPQTGKWGTGISWSSSKPSLISDAGLVLGALLDEEVVLTATVSRADGTSQTKDFSFTVLAAGTTASTGKATISIELPTAPVATALVFKDSGNAVVTSILLARGSALTVNTTFDGTCLWYVDSDAIPASSLSTCSLNGNDFALGLHTLVIDASSGGKSWSGQILFKVVTP
jgi:hypothetical protein